MQQTTNSTELKEMDHTHGRGTKCIDSIAATPNMRKHIEGSSLHETNEIMNADHRSHVIDTNLGEYFKEEFSKWDKIQRGVMEPNIRTHREKFNEHMDEVLHYFPTDSIMANLNEATVIEKELEQLDQDI